MISIQNAPHINDKTVTQAAELVEQLAKGKAGQAVSILDLGTGEGYNSERLAETLKAKNIQYRILAADIDPAVFKARGVPGVEFREANLDKEFDFGRFDVVMATEVLEHVENPYHFLRNALRQVGPGGALFLSSPNTANVYSLLKQLVTGVPSFFHESLHSGHIMPITPYLVRQVLRKVEQETGERYHLAVSYNRNVLLLPFSVFGVRSVAIPGGNRLFGEVGMYRVSKAG